MSGGEGVVTDHAPDGRRSVPPSTSDEAQGDGHGLGLSVNGAQAENSTQPFPFLESWKPNLVSLYKGHLARGWDDLKTRSRPSLRGRGADPKLFAAVEELLLDLWQEEPVLSNPAARLWRLNCLMYSGAELTVRAATAAVMQDCQEDFGSVEEQDEWAITDPGARRESGWAGQISRLKERRRVICRKISLHKMTVKAICREMRRLGQPRAMRRGSSYRARRDRRVLAKRLKSRKLPLVFLRQQKTKLEGTVRVRAAQARRLEVKLRRLELRKQIAGTGYRALLGEQAQGVGDLDAEAVHSYWKGLWGVEGDYNPSHLDIRCWGRKVVNEIDQAGRAELSWDAACFQALLKVRSWRAPGPDGVAGFWYKKFPAVTDLVLNAARELIDGEVQFPHWFVRGRTVLIPKVENASGPEEFRPITCLNIGYKLVTGALCAILSWHVEPIPPEEQKGKRGCLDAL